MSDFLESDWKHLKRVRPEALDRLCRNILDELVSVASSPEGSAHERYLKVWALLRTRDQEVADAFDDFSRSDAFGCLVTMRRLGLVTEEEFAGFSVELRRRDGLLTTAWAGKDKGKRER